MGTIRFSCPTCQRPLRVGEEYAGRQSRCPGCRTAVTVPSITGGGGGALPDWMSEGPARAPAPQQRPRTSPPPTPSYTPANSYSPAPPPASDFGFDTHPTNNFGGL